MTITTKKMILINSIIGILNRVVILILGMVSRRIFIIYLGESVSGLSSLYTNILSFLSIATAGLGTAAIHRIYICNAVHDDNEIIKIEKFTRLFFRCVTCFVFVMGIIFSFFLDKMILNNQYSISFLRTVFLMQVLSECANYWFSSKRIILQALEKLYIISLIEMIVNIGIYILQILLIIKTQNYFLYLITFIIKYTIIGYFIHKTAINEYPWIKRKCILNLKEMKYLFTDLKNTIFLQISTFIFISTDSMVISSFLGLLYVNLYDNYLIIINALTSAIDEINGAVRATFGNLLAKNSSDEKKLNFIVSTTFVQFLLASFCVVSLKGLMDDFVTIWLDEKFILPSLTSNIIIINLYCTFLSSPFKNYMTMCGKFNVDKKITFSSAVINIILSIILVQKIGLLGVIGGTLIGNIMMWIERGWYFFRSYDKKVTINYCIDLLKYFFVTFIVLIITSEVINYYSTFIKGIYSLFMLKLFICLSVPNIITCFLFRKKDEIKKIIHLCRGVILRESKSGKN